MCVPPGGEAYTGVCSLQMRAALSARDGGGEADTCVSPAERSPLSAHDGGDEADTCVCRPQTRVAIPAHKYGAEAVTCVCRPAAQRSPHMVAEARRTRVCVACRALTALLA